jgi:adenylylsulfate kinase-like enzyme
MHQLPLSLLHGVSPCRRIGEVSKLFADSGIITLVSFISPYRNDRCKVRERLQPGQFIEIYMKVRAIACKKFFSQSYHSK